MTDDDGPSRFDTLSHALSRAKRRAIRRFGYANCAHCGHEFIKHRRDQRFCNDGCRYRSYSTLNGRLSTDPRWKLKRKRQPRLAAIRQKDALNRAFRKQRKEIKGLSQQVPSGKNPVGARVASKGTDIFFDMIAGFLFQHCWKSSLRRLPDVESSRLLIRCST